MITKNSFELGLNKDGSKTKLNQKSYDDALDIRLVTDTGRSTGVIVNIKGNELITTIPDTGNVLRITYNSIPSILTTYTVNINGLTDTFTYTGSGNIYEQLESFLESSAAFTTLNLSAYAFNNYLLIYSTNHTNLTISIATTTITTEVASQTDLTIIGYTTIRDTIILLTTNRNNISPTGNNIGQIWKLEYNKVTLQTSPSTSATLTLLYNNNLDFSLEHPICSPGNIIGNYENANIQKIYWCDFYNPIRNFNIVETNNFFKLPEELKTASDVTFDLPVLIDIIQSFGNLDFGLYQFAYKLKNVNGTSTSYSPPSQLISLVAPSETSTNVIAYNDFASTSTGISKSIKMRIDNLDTRYDRIEVIAIKWTNQTNTTTSPDDIYTFLDEPIPSNGIFEFTHTGNENKATVTKEEFITNNFIPEICKTMTTKDNMLLIGNVKLSKLDLDFDCRAFRYPKQFTTTNLTSTNIPIPGSNYLIGDEPDEEDDINPNQNPTSWNNYLYKYNSNTLGGTGLNVSYEFVTDQTHLDGKDLSTSAPPAIFDPGYGISNIVTINDKTYTNINTFKTTASPSIIGVLRGYQRNEIYRFGIIFYDKAGNPGWVNWIGDIQFPDFYMPDTTNTNDQARTLQYPLTTYTSPNTYGNVLGIQFTINNLNQIADKVSGYSIVRVQRTIEDRTILTQGSVNVPHFDTISGTHYSTFGSRVGTDFYYDLPTSIHSANKDHSDQFGIFYSPDVQFTDFRVNLDNSETLEIIGVANDEQEENMYDSSGVAVAETTIQKCSSFHNPVATILPTTATAITKKFAINNHTFAEEYGNMSTYTVDIGNFNNHDITKRSQGGRHLALQLDKDGTFSNSTAAWKNVAYSAGSIYYDGDDVKNSDRIYLARINKTNPDQYGGNTLSERSQSEYILCNHFQPISNTTTTLTSKVYGGDVFLNIYDNVREFKAWSVSGAAATKYAWAFVFPVESYINVALRQGTYTINRSSINNAGSGGDMDTHEDYAYIPLFSNEEFVKPFFPKPVPFNETDVFDTRVYHSDTKIQGETGDSWTVFKTNNYRDVESVYGPLNNLSILSNKLFFWQDRAFGTIPINRRVLQVDQNSGTELQLGEGITMDKHEYISTKTGSKHQWSILTTDKSFYWFDILANKQIRFSQNGLELLSDVHGMHSHFIKNLKGDILINDNPILNKGICSVYDYTYNEAIFTFHDIFSGTANRFTLAYSDQTDSYTSFYSFTPNIYVTDKYTIITPDRTNSESLYVHDYGQYGRFYTTYTDSYVRFLTNEHPQNTKVFSNLEIQTEVLINDVDTSSGLFPIQETINKLRCFNDYQDTGLKILTTNTDIKRKFRSWRTEIPRHSVAASNMSFGFYPRLRDKYNYVELYFTNNNNKRFILHDVITSYMVSPY